MMPPKIELLVSILMKHLSDNGIDSSYNDMCYTIDLRSSILAHPYIVIRGETRFKLVGPPALYRWQSLIEYDLTDPACLDKLVDDIKGLV